MAQDGGGATTVAASASNAILNLFKYGLHYTEIPEEVQQFRHAINNLDDSINVARRLRRVKSKCLDSETKEEVDVTIARSEEVLISISRTIEGCQADLDTKGTVSVKNRLDWLLRGHGAFVGKGMTLNSCLQCLSMQIGRMDQTQLPTNERVATSIHSMPPPKYQDSLYPGNQRLCAPSLRKLRSRQSQIENNRSNSDVNRNFIEYSTEKEVVVQRPTPERDARIVPSVVGGRLASVSSVDDGPLSSRGALSSVSFSVSTTSDPCVGDYCTLEQCSNHGGFVSGSGSGSGSQDDQLFHRRSLDSGLRQQGWLPMSSPFVQESAPKFAVIPAPPRRKRNKSGLI